MMNEEVLDKIIVDLYNKKIIVYTENTTVKFKCSTINEFVELLDKAKQLLKTDRLYYR